ncbi:MAG: molybdenum cofactor guanylyltransferase MobA [Methylophilaceae bacterium]|nr:MAG: molybdenum cofactor guanylyltransferase MobA [Methylophilaceae bacterium]
MNISAIILAGGQANRMGGAGKGLVPLQNKPLVQHTIERLAPQVDEILINANREIERYKAFNLPILKDEYADFIGPLAGFTLGLKHCKHDYLLTAPCDSPLLPEDLVDRMMKALTAKGADIAVAKSAGHTHPVFCLMKKTVLPSLVTYLDQGERKVSVWQKSLNYIEVEFNDNTEAFVNLNTFEALEALALTLGND